MSPDDKTIPPGSDPGSTVDDGHAGRRPDLTSLVAGIGLMALGVLLVLDSENVLDVTVGYLWPALLAVGGAVLLASGRRRREL